MADKAPEPAATPEPSVDDRLAAVLDGISDVYYAVDRHWRFTLFNRAAESFFGAKRDQLLGRDIWEVFPQGRGTEFGRLLEQAMNLRKTGRMTAPSALRPGRTVELRVAPLGADGVGVAIDDVTERTEAERALLRSRERLDLAVGAHAIGIFDWDVPSGAAVWSPEMEDIFGLPRGTFEGHTDHFRRRVVPEDLARIQAETEAALAAGRDLTHYEFRIVRDDGVVRWIEGAARFVFAPDGSLQRIVGTNIDIHERKLAEEHQQLLLNELNHRVKNTLAIVQAIAWQSLRTGMASAGMREAFEGRLAALSAAHDVLTQQNWEAAEIGRIITMSMAPHHAADGRVSIEGPRLDLPPKSAVALSLAVHELATNAVKYGALSQPEGRIDVRWSVDDRRLRLTWRESGGPRVSYPARRGFGARLLEQGLAEELRGSVRLEFHPEGLVCEVDARLEG
ncbi:MAG TPA: HWE histidine kinase domain-containing protein [Phenylobacterium sp.]|nr:HWE histidine kinase domain-containing protein [Phenylobacterium sp.]